MFEKPPPRRSIVAALSAGLALAARPVLGAEPTEADMLTRDIETYVAFGEHRSGTETETRAARWIAGRLGRLGYATRTSAFPVQTLLDPTGAFSVGAVATPAFPQWRAPANSLGRRISAGLDVLSRASPGAIAILENPAPPEAYWPARMRDAALTAHAAGAAALVIAFDEPTDSIYACNQEATADLPLPVATIRPSALKQALPSAGTEALATLRLGGRPTEAHGLYVTAHRPGEGQAIVISTPLTGWFRCGAERGPGVALMLRLAKNLATSRRPVWLVATGGHELGHMGMKQALGAGDLPAPADTAVWVHLGAGIAARALDGRHGPGAPGLLTVSKDLEPALAASLPAADWIRRPPGAAAPGEAGDVIAAGHTRLVALVGGFPGFHTRGDDGSAVDPRRLAGVATALAGLLQSI